MNRQAEDALEPHRNGLFLLLLYAVDFIFPFQSCSAQPKHSLNIASRILCERFFFLSSSECVRSEENNRKICQTSVIRRNIFGFSFTLGNNVPRKCGQTTEKNYFIHIMFPSPREKKKCWCGNFRFFIFHLIAVTFSRFMLGPLSV